MKRERLESMTEARAASIRFAGTPLTAALARAPAPDARECLPVLAQAGFAVQAACRLPVCRRNARADCRRSQRCQEKFAVACGLDGSHSQGCQCDNGGLPEGLR